MYVWNFCFFINSMVFLLKYIIDLSNYKSVFIFTNLAFFFEIRRLSLLGLETCLLAFVACFHVDWTLYYWYIDSNHIYFFSNDK